jgi:putative RecB family exonuclease
VAVATHRPVALASEAGTVNEVTTNMTTEPAVDPVYEEIELPTAVEAWTDPDSRPPLPERLSPSRMGDYETCPRKFFFQSILRLPSEPSIPALRGTVTHSVLEELFKLPAAERTRATAQTLVEGAWQSAISHPVDGPKIEACVADYGRDTFFADIDGLLDNYYTIENPRRFDAEATEQRVEAVIDGFTYLGIIDRLDRVTYPDGRTALWISDYKTGKTPDVTSRFIDEKFNAMRVYAVLITETLGEMPERVRLVYLSGQGREQVLRLDVDDVMIRNTRARMHAVWKAIVRSHSRWDWPTRLGKLCDWCDHRDLCPAYGGTLAGTPVVVTRRVAVQPTETKEAS